MEVLKERFARGQSMLLVGLGLKSTKTQVCLFQLLSFLSSGGKAYIAYQLIL